MAQYAEGASEIDPDAVATTEFTHVFRGYSIDEVKTFLQHVSREMHRLRDEPPRTIQDLAATVNQYSSGLEEAHPTETLHRWSRNGY